MDITITQPPNSRTTPGPRPVEGARFGEDWWQRGVIYQIYPRSFADADGDGSGDLAGIVDHLDHLGPDGLGIDAIWLSPIYRSPGRDGGYDVSDHERIDPRFGTEADFDRLVDEAHRHGIRVVLDLVMNHTSDQHRWFKESRKSRVGPHADWYLWRDPAGFAADGRPIPPNDWLSFFGGPGWEWEPAREQFYFHTFLVEQPELDWRAAGVEEAQFAMVQGWLDRGVDGFRLDVFNIFLKHPDLPSNPVREGRTAWERQVHLHDRDQPDFPALIERFRALVDAEPGRMTVGELFDGTVATAAALTRDHHLVFDWELLRSDGSAAAIRSAMASRDAAYGGGGWPTVVFSNHDQPRLASRFAAGLARSDTDAVARAFAVLSLTLRGTPFLYYGQELGMTDVDIPPGESVDPPATRVDPDFDWWDRSAARTPMPWAPGPGAGFTTGRPWLRLGPDAGSRNVQVQSADPGSVLSAYRRLLALRARSAALQVGRQIVDPNESSGELIVYRREVEGETMQVLLNLGRSAASCRLDHGSDPNARWRVAFDTHDPDPDDRVVDAGAGAGAVVELAPLQGVVLERLA